MKLTVSKSKNSATFYVQKTIRKEDGRTASVTVEKLGNLEEVRTKAHGGDPYKWAQEYVNELNRREYEEQKSIILNFSPSKLIKPGEQKAFNCGYLFLQDIYYGLGLDKICGKISAQYKFEYDLNDVLLKLILTRILYPSSKYAANRLSKKFLEQPAFELHDIYRALSVLAEQNEFIQAEVYKNSQKLYPRGKEILYYDCTNYFFELEEEDDFRRYGKSKQHQPLPIVGMGLFIDQSGVPLAFDLYPGNQSEQPTLKPLEKRILKDFDLSQIIVCTDAGLSSKSNRKFNDRSVNGDRLRSFITTQSVKQLPAYLKEFALDPTGWHLSGTDNVFDLRELDGNEYYDAVFYKDRWIKEDLSGRKIRQGATPLEQHLIVSFSFKYLRYQRKIREGQIERARKLIESGKVRKNRKNQNDPARFIARESTTDNGEICSKDIIYLDEEAIAAEEMYDGFYAVCTNIDDMSISDIVAINKQRWRIEECFRMMKTEFKARPVYVRKEDSITAHFLTCFLALILFRLLEIRLENRFTCEELTSTMRDMMMYRPGEKLGYLPAYTRTEITDALHQTAGFRTDYEIINDINMKRIIRKTKGKK